MLAFLYYCLKAIICSGVLYSYYLLALRNNRFHQWNRWYLLASVILSFTLPLLQIPIPNFFEDKTALVYGVEMLAAPDFYFASHHSAPFQFTLESVSLTVYFIVSLLLLFLFFKNLRKIQLLKHQYREETSNGIHFYNTVEPGTPFSFFKNIFWNNGIDLQTEKGQQMLRHEMAHVTELHSADKVLLQVLLALAFWNPFLYLIRKEIAIVHEFIADQKASAGDDKLQYASLLLMKAMGSQQFALGNPFFHSQLKRRLTMLTTSKNPRFSYIRRLLVLPLAAISLILFSFKYKEVKDKEKASFQNHVILNEKEGFYGDSTKPKFYVQLNKTYKGSAIESIMPTTDMSGAVVKTVDDKTYFLDRAAAAKEFNFIIIDSGFTAPAGAVLVTGTSKVVARSGAFIQMSPNSNFPQYSYTIDTTAASLSKSIPSISLQGDNINTDEYQNMHAPNGQIKIKIDGAPDGLEKALVIVDGVKMGFTKLKELDIKTFKSMDIWRGENAIARYGEEGKNGVIVITTIAQEPLPDNALYILDGVESTKEIVAALDQTKIKTVNVLKGESAGTKYGSKGQNGITEITTTDQTPAWFNEKTLLIVNGKEISHKEMEDLHLGDRGLITFYSEMTPSAAMKVYGEKGRNGAAIATTKPDLTERVVIGHKLVKNEVTFDEDQPKKDLKEVVGTGYASKKGVPLYVIDGVDASKEQADALDPKEIATINVLKGETAIAQYGDKAKNGVVKITTGNRPRAAFTKVDQPASFPGGIDGWRRYLERNLQYPKAAQEKGTQGTVNVQMTVNADGSITEIKALNDPGNGLAAEAERVISKGPKWIPATLNGQPVAFRFIQNLTFQLQ